MGQYGQCRVYDVSVSGPVSGVLVMCPVASLRLQYVFVGAGDKAADQAHLAKRRAAIAVRRRFLRSQHEEREFFGGAGITAVLCGPAGPADDVLKIVRHGMGAFATELRRALGIRKALVSDGAKVEVVRCAGGLLDLAFE